MLHEQVKLYVELSNKETQDLTNTQKRIERIIKKTQSEVHDMTNGFGIELDMDGVEKHRWQVGDPF